MARIRLVQRVLNDTEVIIKGWDRPDKDDCLVYVGHPDVDYQSLTIEIPPKPSQSFLVFVLPDGTVDYWTWRPSDGSTGLPEGLRGQVIWRRN